MSWLRFTAHLKPHFNLIINSGFKRFMTENALSRKLLLRPNFPDPSVIHRVILEGSRSFAKNASLG
jgi:hypothetical protein